MFLRRFRDEEGAAAIELALSTLVLVPMVFYAIYSGEAVTASIKAQEAEISAGWEITAYRLHAYNGGPSAPELLSEAATSSAARVTKDLVDMNSYEPGSRQGRTYTLGRALHQGVECAARKDFGANFGPPFGKGEKYLHADGWVGCQSSVEFRNLRAPKNIHQEFYVGRPMLFPRSIRLLTICGLGNTLKGCSAALQRGFLVFTDDWGLENASPIHVAEYGQNNREYYHVGESIFNDNGGSSPAMVVSMAMGMTVGAGDQGQTGRFKMGYLQTVGTPETVDSEPGPMKAHLSPYDETATAATNNTADLSKSAYENGTRKAGNYMGHPDPNWNRP